jgi:hypothetical protein
MILNIVPQPKSVKMTGDETFKYGSVKISLNMCNEDERLTELASKLFKTEKSAIAVNHCSSGYLLLVNTNSGEDVISRYQSEVKGGKDGYFLKIDTSSIAAFSEQASGLFYALQTMQVLIDTYNYLPCVEIADWADIEMRCMNFDLRQVFPKYENMLKYIEEFAKYKVNTVLLEYEDKIPFKKHPELQCKEFVFTEEQLKTIQETARRNFIEIIPLQQTFGHLEYVLRQNKYKSLREKDNDIAAICPLKPEAFELVTDLISDMIDFHPEARYIHIGCDEVFSLCKCDKCMSKFNGNKNDTFIYHINKLIDFVAGKGKIPIIWHDMIEHFSEEEIRRLDSRAVVMIWIYYGNEIGEQVSSIAGKLRKCGIEVKGAPSISCHDRKDDQNMPVIARRVPNILQWSEIGAKLDIKCVVATHWMVANSLAMPYSVYESGFYLILFAAERLWNTNSDSTTYASRFLKIFHGIDAEKEGKDYSDPTCYYDIIGDLAEKAVKNRSIAELIGIMKEYETALFRFEQVNKYSSRVCTLDVHEGERTFLLARYKEATELMESARREMKEKAEEFLPGSLKQVFLNSRFFIYDYLSEKLYKKL